MVQRGMPVAAEAAQQRGRPDRLDGPVQLAERLLEQPDGLVGGAGLGGRLGRPSEQLDPVQPGQPVRIGDLLPQLQGALVVPVRFGEGAGMLSRPAGSALVGSPAPSQWAASTAAATAGTAPASSGRPASAFAYSAWSRTRSPGSRSAATTSRRRAWRNW